MNRIFKYEFGLMTDEILMPLNAQILKADKQGDGLYLWALVDDDNPMSYRGIKIIGTGHPIEESLDNLKYINSVFDGLFVWHVFEVLN